MTTPDLQAAYEAYLDTDLALLVIRDRYFGSLTREQMDSRIAFITRP